MVCFRKMHIISEYKKLTNSHSNDLEFLQDMEKQSQILCFDVLILFMKMPFTGKENAFKHTIFYLFLHMLLKSYESELGVSLWCNG